LVLGSQTWPDWQSALAVQVVLQPVVPLQVYGAHIPVVAFWQFPAPSQVRALVSVDDPVGQLAAAQMVPAAYFEHAPDPLQTPVVPHDAEP
jgi:hypothetical protein